MIPAAQHTWTAHTDTTGQATLYNTLHRDELNLIAAFACTLNEKPGKNWVEAEGGLPDYICRIARAIKRSGKTTSQAIAIAVSRVKKWAAGGGDVDADTRAKAAKAVAQWEKLKAKSGSHKFRASRTDPAPAVLALTSDYNVDIVRTAWEERIRQARTAWFAANPNGRYDDAPASGYVKELWNTYLITQDGYGDGAQLYKVGYTVGDDGQTVSFAEPERVKVEYVTVTDDDLGGALTDADLQKLVSTTAAFDNLAVGLNHLGLALAGLRAPQAPGQAINRIVELANSDKAKKPYGDVSYADPGYQKDGKKRYPIDTADHVRAAWSYVNQQANAAKYTAAQLKAVKGHIKAAARRLGVQISD